MLNTARLMKANVVFNAEYSPFFNPIELFFSVVKALMRRRYQEGAIPKKDLPAFVSSVLASLSDYDMRKTFESCGYGVTVFFDARRLSRTWLMCHVGVLT